MATIFIFDLITTIDKNLYVIYNILYNQGVFIMSNENQKDNNKVSIMPFIILFLISIVIFAFLYFLHSKNIENRFNNTLQNYEKSINLIFENAITNNGSNENIYSAKEDLKLSFEVGFKMLESSINEIMKSSNDILQFWFAFLSVIMIVFTLIGFFLNNNILNQTTKQLEIVKIGAKNYINKIKKKSKVENDKLIENIKSKSNEEIKKLIQELENEYNQTIEKFKEKTEKENNELIENIKIKAKEESKKLTEESNLYVLGVQAYNDKNYNMAEYYFSEFIISNPENSLAYNNRGASIRKIIQYSDKSKENKKMLIYNSIEDFNKAIKLDNDKPVYYYNRGNSKCNLASIVKEENEINKYNQLVKEAYKDFKIAYNLSNGKLKEDLKNKIIGLAKEKYEAAIKFCEEHNINYNNNKE